ncbi:MAG: hypothetical protein ABGY96_25060 [bacterium]|nr:hypothetical protein [Gammaproteobacteria bacterium]
MRSIAVLPFANMSTNEETGFLADGLSEDILDNLAQAESIRVASRSAAFQYVDPGQDPAIIGQKLKVAYLLEGSVRQRDDNVRITAQLIRISDGFHVWSKSYERTLADGFEMQTTVASNIAIITRSELIHDIFKNHGWKQNEDFIGIDPIAVEHFIMSTNEYRNIRLGEGGDLATSALYLKNAVEIDPNFLIAYNSLVSAYLLSHGIGKLPLHEARPAAHAASSRAIALAPNDFSAQLQLTRIHFTMELDYARAEVEFNQVLTQHPQISVLNMFLAEIALREGRINEALMYIAKFSFLRESKAKISYVNFGEAAPLLLGTGARYRCYGGDYEGALKLSAQGLQLAEKGQDRASILRAHACGLLGLGRVEQAKPIIDEGWQLDGSTRPEWYISLLARAGEIQRAKNILTNPRFDLADEESLAMGHLVLGNVDDAFKYIQAGIEDHNRGLLNSLLVAEWWDPIRGDPRFHEMLELLDSKVTHTEQYLRDHKITQPEQ